MTDAADGQAGLPFDLVRRRSLGYLRRVAQAESLLNGKGNWRH